MIILFPEMQLENKRTQYVIAEDICYQHTLLRQLVFRLTTLTETNWDFRTEFGIFMLRFYTLNSKGVISTG